MVNILINFVDRYNAAIIPIGGSLQPLNQKVAENTRPKPPVFNGIFNAFGRHQQGHASIRLLESPIVRTQCFLGRSTAKSHTTA